MRFRGRIEVVCKTDPDPGELRFGFEGRTSGGDDFTCYENDSEIDRIFQAELHTSAKRLTPLMADPLLVLCLAKLAPERLRDLGWICDDAGRVRVGSFAKLDRFVSYAGAEKNPTHEKELQKNLRVKLPRAKGSGLLDFEYTGKARWAFLRLDKTAQIHIEPDVIEKLVARIRAEMAKVSRSAPTRSARQEAMVEQFARVLAVLVDRIIDGIGPASPTGTQDIVARLLGRVERWPLKMLEILRSPDGFTATVKFVALLLWGGSPPLLAQKAELLSILALEMPGSVQGLLANHLEHAKTEALRETGREALGRQVGPEAREAEARVAVATLAELRQWMIAAMDGRRFVETIQSTTAASANAGGCPPA